MTVATARELTNRVIVVTGASAGIGRATVERLTAAGATVVGAARQQDRLDATQRDVPGLDVRTCDVTDAADRKALIDGVLADHGRIDGLVNNAGVGWTGLVEQMSLEDVERVYATNVIGLIDLTRLVLPGMLQRGDGDIVMISSGAAWVSLPPLTVYSSTKYAVDGFVEGLRREVWTRGVRVHSVNPGPVSTEWLSRGAGYQPGEDDPAAKPSPGIPADMVAAAVERSLTRRWSRTAAVPRVVGLGRLLQLQPLRTAVDVGIGLTAQRLAAAGQAMSERRTPGR